jgi:hypothetical protein
MDTGYSRPMAVITGKMPSDDRKKTLTYSYLIEENQLTIHERGKILFKGWVDSFNSLTKAVLNIAEISETLILEQEDLIEFRKTEKGMRSLAFERRQESKSKEPFDYQRDFWR